MSLHTASIGELARGLAAGQYSAVELTRHFLDRIGRFNPALNAFVTVTAEQALAAAAAADASRAAGRAGTRVPRSSWMAATARSVAFRDTTPARKPCAG